MGCSSLRSMLVAWGAALGLAAAAMAAIDRGAIQGTITDQQGSVIPGARVTVKNLDTNVAPLVENTASNFTTMSPGDRYTQELPLPGCDIQALVQLVPGVTQASGPSGVLFGFNSDFGNFPGVLPMTARSPSSKGRIWAKTAQ